MPPPTDRDLAEFAGAAIFIGLLRPESVIAWGDTLVATRSPVPPWAAELSLAGGNCERTLQELLAEVPGETSDGTPLQLLLGLLYREWHNGRLDWRAVQGIAWALSDARNRPAASPDWAARLNDEAIIPKGCDDAAAARAVNRELSPFADYIRCLPTWA
jgi:hypothetical protein